MPAAIRRASSQTGDGPIVDVAEEPSDVARAALEVLDRDRRRAPRRPASGSTTGRWRELEVVRAPRPRARCRRPRGDPAGCRSTRRGARRRRAGTTSASGVPGSAPVEHHDPGVVGAELDLVLGEDHPVGELAAHLAPLERRGRPGASRRAARPPPSRPLRSSRRRRRSAAARPRRRRPGRAGAGRRSGAWRPRAPCRRGRARGCRPRPGRLAARCASTSAVETSSRSASSSSGMSIGT